MPTEAQAPADLTSSSEAGGPSRRGRLQRLLDRLQRLLPVQVGLRYAEVDAGNWAAAIALNILVSLFPMVLLTLFVVSLVLRSPEAYASVLQQFARVLPGGTNGDAYHELEGTLSAVRSSTGLLGVISLLGLLWAGSGLFGCIEAALARVNGSRPRDFVHGKLTHFLMIFAMFVLTLIGIVGTTALNLLAPIAESHGAGNILTGTWGFALQAAIGTAVGLVLAGLIYEVLPRPHPTPRQILPGTLLAGVVFELLTLLFPLYIGLSQGGNRYGATFFLLLVLITWCSFLAQILMIGACLNSVVDRRRRERATASTRSPAAPIAAGVPADRTAAAGVPGDEIDTSAQPRPTAAGGGGVS